MLERFIINLWKEKELMFQNSPFVRHSDRKYYQFLLEQALSDLLSVPSTYEGFNAAVPCYQTPNIVWSHCPGQRAVQNLTSRY